MIHFIGDDARNLVPMILREIAGTEQDHPDGFSSLGWACFCIDETDRLNGTGQQQVWLHREQVRSYQDTITRKNATAIALNI